VGMTVGQRWTLLGVIGSGGTATVYEAVHRNGSRVAVKMLHADFHSHERIRRRFLAEGYAANLVRHEGAVKVLDDGETEQGGAYLVMELLEGETLAARLLRDGPLPAEQVLAWGIAVLEILASAHEHHVVHRDVKPSNIFITRLGQVKLLDFGIARISAYAAEDEFLTQQGVALGTPAFMAPEQATGSLEEIGAATDIWGVGATLFQLLTGRAVQEQRSASSPSEVGLAAPPVRAFAPNLAPELAKVIDRALSLRASARWPAARAMIRALELAREVPLSLNTASDETLTEEAMIVPRPALISRPNLGFAAGGFVMTLAGLYWALSPPRTSPTDTVPSAAVAPSGKAPVALVTAAVSVETAATALAPSTNPPIVSAPASQERAAVPLRMLGRSSGPLPHPTASKTAAARDRAADLDSILDRRK
jgi:eukaryotic-like serine/threonine-protein kinase